MAKAKTKGVTPASAAFAKLCLAIKGTAEGEHGRVGRAVPDDRRVFRIANAEARDFAVWVDGGKQPGPHVRVADPKKSGFKASTVLKVPTKNWVHAAGADPATLKTLVAASHAISQQRGGGVFIKLFPPLKRAVELADPALVPDDLHAGGPVVKIKGQEGIAAFRLLIWMIETVEHLAPAKEKAALDASLAELRAANALWVEVLPELMKVGGRMGKHIGQVSGAGKRLKKPPGDSAPLAIAREAVEAYRMVPGGYDNYAVDGAKTAVALVMPTLAGKAITKFLAELDDRILFEELCAQMLVKGSNTPPKQIVRVLWRGADDKGFPAFWVVREDRSTYALFWKLGSRWTFTEGDRDNVLANVPDAHFEAAVAMTIKRDVG